MENQSQDIIKIKHNSYKFVPKKESDRYDAATGKYNNNPLDPEYYKMYWRTKNEQIPCDHCGKLVGKLRMCKHIKTRQCQKVQKIDQLIQLEESVFQALEILEKTSRNVQEILGKNI